MSQHQFVQLVSAITPPQLQSITELMSSGFDEASVDLVHGHMLQAHMKETSPS